MVDTQIITETKIIIRFIIHAKISSMYSQSLKIKMNQMKLRLDGRLGMIKLSKSSFLLNSPLNTLFRFFFGSMTSTHFLMMLPDELHRVGERKEILTS